MSVTVAHCQIKTNMPGAACPLCGAKVNGSHACVKSNARPTVKPLSVKPSYRGPVLALGDLVRAREGASNSNGARMLKDNGTGRVVGFKADGTVCVKWKGLGVGGTFRADSLVKVGHL